MPAKNRRNLIINSTQIAVWAGVFFAPALVTVTMTRSLEQSAKVFMVGGRILRPFFLLFSLNYYFLVPKLLHAGRKTAFYLINLSLILAWVAWKSIPRGPLDFPQEVVDQFGRQGIIAMYVGSVFMMTFILCLMVLLAMGLRKIMRANEVMTAELTWLKHQLNPHFLFNTLNNISSLTQIDPDRAQESIGQLSDLLRYALYDSEAEKVPLQSEVEFMGNYIDLMALRCNELTTVTKELKAPQEHVEVAPLLFISLVENAFKHGVNARYPSFVKVFLGYAEGIISFRTENSLFEKQGSDHIGSGIGLENMKRRLELLYPGKYTYSQKAGDGTYSVEVTLKV